MANYQKVLGLVTIARDKIEACDYLLEDTEYHQDVIRCLTELEILWGAINDEANPVKPQYGEERSAGLTRCSDGDRERCPECGMPTGPMPEDAAYEERLCNKCYEKLTKEELS